MAAAAILKIRKIGISCRCLLIFCHFNTEMLCAGCGGRQCRGKSNIMLNKICKILKFLCHFVNSAHNCQFCASYRILRYILCAQNCRILTSLIVSFQRCKVASFSTVHCFRMIDGFELCLLMQEHKSIPTATIW